MSEGLRNPGAAVRGVGAVTLVVWAVVLLLALLPMYRLGGAHRAEAIWLCAGLAVCCFLLTGLLRYPWAWPVGLVVPVALLLGGFLHPSLVGLAVVFGLTWAYVLNVRRSVYANKPGAG
jgi:hypothetical protein